MCVGQLRERLSKLDVTTLSDWIRSIKIRLESVVTTLNLINARTTTGTSHTERERDVLHWHKYSLAQIVSQLTMSTIQLKLAAADKSHEKQRKRGAAVCCRSKLMIGFVTLPPSIARACMCASVFSADCFGCMHVHMHGEARKQSSSSQSVEGHTQHTAQSIDRSICQQDAGAVHW